MLELTYNSQEAFDKLVQYASLNKMFPAPKPKNPLIGERKFRRLCRETIGYENICTIVRAVSPESFEQHFTRTWLTGAKHLDYVFQEEGGLPRDNYLMQELDRRAANSLKTFDKLVAYAYINNKVPNPRNPKPVEEGIWKFYRESIGYENICVIVRAVTPENFAQHYTHRWAVMAQRLDYVFQAEGGLPRDNFLMEELDRIFAEDEAKARQIQESIANREEA